MSEHDYLLKQAADARMACIRSLAEMKRALKSLLDVRSCAARHPWMVTGSAAAAGVVAGAMLRPVRRTRSRSRRAAAAHGQTEVLLSGREHGLQPATISLLRSIAGSVLTAVLPHLVQRWFAPAETAKRGESSGAPPAADAAGSVVSSDGVD